MKTLYKALILVILIATAAFFVSEQLVLTGTPTNINFGDIPTTNPYDTVGKYYIAEFAVAGDSAGLVFVPKGLQYEKDRLELKISSVSSTYKAPITIPPTYLQYRQVKYIFGIPGLEWKNVDYRDVDLSSPFVYTNSKVQLSAPGSAVKTTTVVQEGVVDNVGETVKRFVVTHEGVERTIYVRFDNLVFKSGDLPLAGDYVVFKDHLGEERFVRYDHLSAGTGGTGGCYADDWNDWNCYVANTFVRLGFSKIDSYEDYCNWMYSGNKIPDKCPPTANTCSFVSNELLIDYPSTVFTQRVTVYVPEELAEFIMLVEQTPKFEFDPIPDINGNEGQVVLVNVKGTAIYSGTINLRMEGPGLESVDWVKSTQQTIIKGTEYTFPAYVKLSQVGTDSKLSITVYSRPLGMGYPTQTMFYANIADTTAEDKYNLRVKCIDTNNKIVDNAKIYIDNEFIGYGDITSNVVKGNHYVYAENVTGWYSGYTVDHQKFVAVDKDMTLEIPFTKDPPKKADFEYNEILLIGGFAIIAIILLSLIANELGAKITMNQIIVMAILVVLVIVGYVLLSITYEMIDRIVTAIEDFKLIG